MEGEQGLVKKALVFALFACIAALCVSCARNPEGRELTETENNLIGRWERARNLPQIFDVVADTLEFREDGTCYVDGRKMLYKVFTGRLFAEAEEEEILAVEWSDELEVARKMEFSITFEEDGRLFLIGEATCPHSGRVSAHGSVFNKL